MAWYEPIVRVDADGNILGVNGGLSRHELHDQIVSGRSTVGTSVATAPATIATHTGGTAGSSDATLIDSLSGTENYDLLAVNLTGGTTYSFAYRGADAGGIEDPYLALFGPGFAYVTEDDDGGYGRTSTITFTPESDGTYYLYATSWYTLAFGDPSLDTGNYTIDVWTANAANDVPGTFEGALEIGEGTTFGQLETAGDRDMYVIDLAPGQLYTFTYAGGISDSADWDDEPGENIGVLRLYDADGNIVASGVNYETSIGFFAEEGGTYYLRVDPYESAMTGGYTVDVHGVDLADYDPLDSIDWRNADDVPFVDVDGVPTAYVYFAPAGENFGELADDGETPMTTYGWEQFQIDGVMRALDEYEHILGVNYEIATDPEQATFRLLTTTSEQYGAYFYPQDPAYGDAQGIGVFNLNSGGFTLPASLQPGGFSFEVILHEFGHAHGLAHPHDTGGGSDIMLGVNGATGSLGVYDLNQGIYTVMSYNSGWETHPDGPLPLTLGTVGYGWPGTLSAFDVAELQERYGVHAYNQGDTVYTLPDSNEPGTYFQTIWDSGGTDSIRYDGELDAQIDLLAATLDYSPTGGGVVSFVDGIYGGYTIANGAVIENAIGGSGNDLVLGNSTANSLTGNNGSDALFGREGDDTLNAGNGDDSLDGGAGADILNGANGNDVLSGGAGNDTLNGGKGNDIFVFENDGSTDTIADFKKGADKIDLSHIAGVTAADVSYNGSTHQVQIDTDHNGTYDMFINVSGTVAAGDYIFG